jgi:hypothetical protein
LITAHDLTASTGRLQSECLRGDGEQGEKNDEKGLHYLLEKFEGENVGPVLQRKRSYELRYEKYRFEKSRFFKSERIHADALFRSNE